MWVCRLRDSGTECTGGPRPHDCHGATEGRDLRVDGKSERAVIDQDIQAVQGSERKALLGQSFLVERILRRHSWSRCGNDPEVRKIPGKEGTVRGAVETGDLDNEALAQLHAAPTGGRRIAPLWGVTTKPRPSGVDSFTRNSAPGSSLP